MSDQSRINNWYDGELVSVDDMKYTNALMMQTLFGSMKPGKVLGIVPTISGGAFSVTAGFAFFGTTIDPTYIANTGVTTIFATIPAEGGIALVNPNCYIYVKPDITTELSNRYTLVTGTVYSSTNASDVGIKICDVIDGIPRYFNNNNIGDYFNFSDSGVRLASPGDGTNSGLRFFVEQAWVGDTLEHGGVFMRALSPTQGYVGSNSTGIGGANGIVFDETQPRPLLNQTGKDAPNGLASLEDLTYFKFSEVVDSGGHNWKLNCYALKGPFPGNSSNPIIIFGHSDDFNFPSGNSTYFIDLNAAEITNSPPNRPCSAVISIDNPKKYANLGTLIGGVTSDEKIQFNIEADGADSVPITFILSYD